MRCRLNLDIQYEMSRICHLFPNVGVSVIFRLTIQLFIFTNGVEFRGSFGKLIAVDASWGEDQEDISLCSSRRRSLQLVCPRDRREDHWTSRDNYTMYID